MIRVEVYRKDKDMKNCLKSISLQYFLTALKIEMFKNNIYQYNMIKNQFEI